MSEEGVAKYETKDWVELLTGTPPGAVYEVPNFVIRDAQDNYRISLPALQLFCGSENCGGPRLFDGQTVYTDYAGEGTTYHFLNYYCRNCRGSRKTFAIRSFRSSATTPLVLKFGEFPAYGPPIPSRVISLMGPDRELFLLGRRAENQGLGLGAFAYYRRVVENQKGRLIDEIAKVARRLGASQDTLDKFEAAKAETQFSKAVDDVKDAIPESLRIQGHNPLRLLHSALSQGLHAQSDAECLELATSIRVVLTELAERISQVLKDDAELKQALTRLLNRPGTP